jgi:hypothetical protein
MALRMWYRGTHFVKDYIAQYLNYIFYANEKGSIVFTDGRKAIKFSSRPTAMKRASWDFRVLPAVLIGNASGNLQYITFAKDILKTRKVVNDDGVHTDTYTQVGGDFDLSVNVTIRATTVEERDHLTDIVAIYLAHPDAKTYFENHYLTLPEGPRFVGDRDVKEPNIDHPIFETSLSLRVLSRWQEENETQNDRLLDVISDVTEYVGDIIVGSSGREIL